MSLLTNQCVEAYVSHLTNVWRLTYEFVNKSMYGGLCLLANVWGTVCQERATLLAQC